MRSYLVPLMPSTATQPPVAAWGSFISDDVTDAYLIIFSPLSTNRKQSRLMMSFKTPPLRCHPPIAKRFWIRKGITERMFFTFDELVSTTVKYNFLQNNQLFPL